MVKDVMPDVWIFFAFVKSSDTRIFSPLLYQLSYLGIWSVNCCVSQALS